MKKLTTIYFALGLSALAVLILSSCSKSASSLTPTSTTTSSISATTVSSGNILVATSATTSGSTAASTKDSVYLMNACPAGKRPDTVAFSALSSTITAYFTANYLGYTFQKAFKVTNSSGTVTGYVVVINYNGKPVGLSFDASGTFVKVLEQRQPADLNGPGWHQGGMFDNRNGLHGDTVAISALPAAIKTYFTKNYMSDTLLHAVVLKDTSYIVFTADKGLFATSFTSKLAYSNRIQLYPRPMHTPVLQANLPSAITTYLTATYAGYVFDKAFAEKVNGVITKYVVLIDASGTRYAVQFDAYGTFVKATTVK